MAKTNEESATNLMLVKTEGNPQRCEVCHTADEFDSESGVCGRCKDVVIPTQAGEQENKIIIRDIRDSACSCCTYLTRMVLELGLAVEWKGPWSESYSPEQGDGLVRLDERMKIQNCFCSGLQDLQIYKKEEISVFKRKWFSWKRVQHVMIRYVLLCEVKSKMNGKWIIPNSIIINLNKDDLEWVVEHIANPLSKQRDVEVEIRYF